MKKFMKLSNKGSTLVAVIVTVGLVGVFSSMAMMVTSTSFQTKHVDSSAKENFYSAEEVIDQIKIGLQNEMAQSISEAYFMILSKYGDDFYDELIQNSDSVDLKGENGENVGIINQDKIDEGKTERLKAFKKECVDNFLRRIGWRNNEYGLGNGTSTGNICNLVFPQFLSKGYLKENESKGNRVDILVNGIMYEYDTDENGFINELRIVNIGVTFTNSFGYTNTIYTDFKVNIPDVDFDLVDYDTNTAYEQYALMARNNVTSKNNYVDVDGGIWVGENLNLERNTCMDLTAQNAYVGKRIDVNTKGGVQTKFKFNADKDMSNTNDETFVNNAYLAAGDIMLEGDAPSGKWQGINCKGNVYVANDLSLNVDKVQANFVGTYHGYGAWQDSESDHTDASKYSSIIINNRDCALNMDLRQLTIYGSAFIKTVTDSAGNDYKKPTAMTDIVTGDSLMVRGNQIAYLVPTQYMPTNTNPVTQAEAKAVSAASSEPLFNDSIKDKFKPMRDYISGVVLSNDLKDLLDNNEPIKTIYYKYSDSAGTDDYVAYFYFNFKSPTAASNYYHHAQDTDENGIAYDLVSATKKNTLLGLIPTTINVRSDDYSVIGNYVTQLETTQNGVSGTPIVEEGYGDLKDLRTSENVVKYLRAFLKNEYPRKMQENDSAEGLSDSDKLVNKNAIDTIIDWDEISSSDVTTDELIKQNISVQDSNGNNVTAQIWVQKGDMTISFSSTGMTSPTGIYIATGDIDIPNNVTVDGLIISGGNITISSGATLKATPQIIRGIFAKAATVKGTKGGANNPLYFNKVFNGYDLNNTATNPDTQLEVLKIDDMFECTNWHRN